MEKRNYNSANARQINSFYAWLLCTPAGFTLDLRSVLVTPSVTIEFRTCIQAAGS